MFFDKYSALCDRKNISMKRAATEIGISPSIPGKWRDRGSTPNGETLKKIADYFGVSVSELLGDEQKEKSPIKPDGGLHATQYDQLNDENKAAINLLIAKLLKSQSGE